MQLCFNIVFLDFSQTDKEWLVDSISKDEGRHDDSPYTRLFFNPGLMSNDTDDGDYQMVNVDIPVAASKPPPLPQRLAVSVRNTKRKQQLKDKQFMICREVCQHANIKLLLVLCCTLHA